MWTLRWRSWSITSKASMLLVMMLAVMICVVGCLTVIFRTNIQGTNGILEDYAAISGFLTAFSAETDAMEQLVRGELTSEAYRDTAGLTDLALLSLLASAEVPGSRRYFSKRSIKGVMEHFRGDGQRLFSVLESGQSYVPLYYSMLTQAGYIDGYTKDLIRYSVEESSGQHQALAARLDRHYVLVLVLTFGASCVVLVIFLVFLGSIVRPITLLAAAAATFHKDLDTPDIMLDRGDELGLLSQSFNNMKHRVRDTIRALSEKARMEERLRLHETRELQMTTLLEEQRFQLLQNQIKPHFLFNTLNTITSMAQIERAVVCEDLTIRLAQFFRYCLESDQTVVALEQELRMVIDYVELQLSRFGSRFSFELRCRQETDGLSIPKFTVQPLVENAIFHGMKNCESGGRIRLDVRRRAGAAEIRVLDNGCGFRDPGRPTGNSIGLHNIRERIRIHGGDFTIFSIPGRGTVARITLPPGGASS